MKFRPLHDRVVVKHIEAEALATLVRSRPGDAGLDNVADWRAQIVGGIILVCSGSQRPGVSHEDRH